MRLVLATHNSAKVRELAKLLEPCDVQALAADIRLPPETGSTFRENATIKAVAAAAATGLPVLADDSGIEAAALGGAPGVFSARYAGPQATDEQNLDKLRREVPAGGALRYVCVLCFIDPGEPVEAVFEGCCDGRMAAAPRGSGGFGYDPVFLPDDGPPGLTMAQLTPAQKDAISHRGRAARALLQWLAMREAGALRSG